MESKIYIIVADGEKIIKASPNRESLERYCEAHEYDMRSRAIEELGQDDDGDPEDLSDAELYAAQNYESWSVGWVSKDILDESAGNYVPVQCEDSDPIHVSSSEILSLLHESNSDDDFWDSNDDF